jgi:nucleotide-binding universal stress UspA family protein
MPEQILVPLDGSPLAENAISLGLDIAHMEGVALRLLQVITHECQFESAEQYLKKTAEKAADRGVACFHNVVLGVAADTIVRLSGDSRMVVMASHGRSKYDHVILGSVTEQVIRRSLCPVLVTKNKPVRLADFRKVLLPLDGFELSLDSIPHAKKFCSANSGKLILSRVSEATGFEVGLHSKEEEGEVMKSFLLGVADQVNKEISLDILFDFGSAARVLLKQIQDNDIDLVVMTSHGRGGFNRWLCGSVAENLVRTSPVPVLIIRADASRGPQEEVFQESLSSGLG